jgi:hypothetical protein
MKSKGAVLGAIGIVVLGLFAAGFVGSWLKARDDKSACQAMTSPPGAASVRVQRQNDETRDCVWLDRQGKTVEEQPLP